MILHTPAGDLSVSQWPEDTTWYEYRDLGIPTAGVATVEEAEDYLDRWEPGTRIPRRIKYRMMLDRLTLYEELITELAEMLIGGEITPREWEERMAQEIKGLHLTAYVTGRSGRWEDMTSQDYGSVGGVLRKQYRYLRRWRAQLSEPGVLELTDVEGVVNRAKLYGAASSSTFERGHGAENGIPPGTLPAYPGDGTTLCLTNCKCWWSIRVISKERGDFDANWRLGPAEHCRTCRARAKDWLGLRIRGGELVDGYAPHFVNRD